MRIRSLVRSLVYSSVRAITAALSSQRFAPNFDSVDDYGVLATRAINPDGDIVVEWTQIGVALSSVRAIVTQCNSGTFTAREFSLRWNSTDLMMSVGGSDVILTTDGIANTDGAYRLTYTGSTITVFRNGVQIFTNTSRPRGAAREPAAPTRIGVRNSSGSLVDFVSGIIYNIRINGVLWAMDQRNQAIQLPSPSGLADEFITPTVLENPFSKGTQWTYLGAGRWQYIGDGSLNELIFINAASQPASGFLEFEIESISGQLNCTSGNNSPSAVFSDIGVKRYFYTAKGSSNENTFLFKRHFSGVGIVTSCIIKNISFKPLGTCNPMTLVNVTSDRWQEVPQ